MGPDFWPVLYAHINQTLSKVISLLFDEDVIVVILFNLRNIELSIISITVKSNTMSPDNISQG